MRAKEVKPGDIPLEEWSRVNNCDNQPRRVAWSYVWAVMWMLRAIEASQLTVGDVIVKPEERVVKLYIKKSKMDQKALGTWRTLRCCGREECLMDCPFRPCQQDLK